MTDVGHPDGLTAGSRRAGNTLADRNTPILHDVLLVAYGEAVDEHLASLIEQHHGENLIIDKPLDQRGYFGENTVQIERGIDLFTDFRKRGEDALGQLLSQFGF